MLVWPFIIERRKRYRMQFSFSNITLGTVVFSSAKEVLEQLKCGDILGSQPVLLL